MHGKRDHVGQIVFAARVAIVDARKPAFERRCRRRHHAGVDLANSALFGACVLLLDDGRYFAAGVTHDASVAAGIVELDGQQRQGAVLRTLDDLPQRRDARQRIGAEQYQGHAVGR